MPGDPLPESESETQDTENLGGWYSSLDGVDEPIALHDGLLSKDGWYFLDDKKTKLWTDDDWMEPRQNQALYQDGYFFGYDHDYKKAMQNFVNLTGKTPLLPRYAFGNWFSRYCQYTADEYKDIVDKFRSNQIPLDVLVVDTDFKSFNSWNGWNWSDKLFPDPQSFLDWKDQEGLHLTLNIHAGIMDTDPRFQQAQDIANNTLINHEPAGDFEWIKDEDGRGASGISFYHKGEACNINVVLSTVEDSDNYHISVSSHTTWTKVTVYWDDLAQADWGTPVDWDASQITSLIWQVSGATGETGEIWIDEVKVMDATIETTIPTEPNEPPQADAGSDQALDNTTGKGSASVTLDGSGSTDPDGTIDSYEWKENDNLVATGVNPTIDISTGSHTLTLIVTDDSGDTSSDQVSIEISSTTSIRNTPSKKDVYIYPSLVSERLHIQSNHGTVEKIEIYNLSNMKIKENYNCSQMDVTELNEGIYIVKVIVDGKKTIRKIIKK